MMFAGKRLPRRVLNNCSGVQLSIYIYSSTLNLFVMSFIRTSLVSMVSIQSMTLCNKILFEKISQVSHISDRVGEERVCRVCIIWCLFLVFFADFKKGCHS